MVDPPLWAVRFLRLRPGYGAIRILSDRRLFGPHRAGIADASLFGPRDRVPASDGQER